MEWSKKKLNEKKLVCYLFRYFCRSVEFDDQTKQCILSEEDSISQKDDISVSSSPTHHFYDLVCLDNRKSYKFNFEWLEWHSHAHTRVRVFNRFIFCVFW